MEKMSATDFQICHDSVSSETDDSCGCPPEYYCAFVCGEDYTLPNTPISWQNFPRSTSSRSYCDDSSAEVPHRTISESTVTPVLEKPESESTKTTESEYPITKSFAQLRAQHYLQIRYIYDFLNFLISHLVCNEPDDPVQFLVDLLDKCLKFRNSFGEPPLLFTHNHVKSLYTAFDPFERGYLTLQQYDEAMKSLGLENSITPYNKDPPLNEEGHVEESFFTFESDRCLIENLRKMLRIPKMWEENRLLWQKRMQKKAMESSDKNSIIYEEHGEFLEEIEHIQCKCNPQAITPYCLCPYKSEIKCTVEQLFLD